jgi:hypothetical protein
MKKLFIVMKSGESLMPEVLKGIVDQTEPCAVIPITNKGKDGFSENHRRLNVVEAMDLNHGEDYFLMMDCDVVLNNSEMIKEMFDETKTFRREIISTCTKGEHVSTCTYIPHALILFKGFKMREFYEWMKNTVAEGEGKEFCLICRWLNSNHNLDYCVTLQNDKIKEVPRIDLTKEEVAA